MKTTSPSPDAAAVLQSGRRRWLGRLAGTALTTAAAGAALARPAAAASPGVDAASLVAGGAPDAIVMMPAWKLSREIHARRVSCREVMAAYLTHIDRVNPASNAIVALRERDVLLREAEAADQALAAGKSAGWMHGMPQAPKDLALTRGIRTTFGSPIFKDNVPASDAIIVERVRKAGAILVGKTNTPEFGLGSQTFNPVYGATRNPYDATRCAGGSSGGAAAALALRMLPVADGSDFGGSLRNPAGYCNVYGFRPSMGRVPYGPTAEVFLQQLGYEGPMGRTVADVALLLATQSGPDPRTPLALARDEVLAGLTPDNVMATLHANLKGKRVAWLGNWDGYLPMEDGILPLCEEALQAFPAFGVSVEAIRPPFAPERLWKTWLVHRHFLVGNGMLPFYRDPAKRALLKPEAVWEIEGALRLDAADIYAASAERSAWAQALQQVFANHDFIAVPTAQVFPFDVREPWPKQIAGRQMDTYHRWMEVVFPWTLSGCPVISVPVGFSHDGLPMGLQLIGRPRDDLGVLRLARAYEQERDWVGRHLPRAMMA
ncbi:amidase [Cupriavidus neocaledonicus]|uniref:Amidase n=1 Tax=Cupriavidus neocaledonicus TaxID=1040979 RepID=A0A375H5W9_9BURK|nr:amidase [Cupriavidus neocaledonicus]SOZ34887.1 Amidase [Cupriavidus neocaledonicus]SPD46635.1 Amidase [Cupriavidus neocaledonicus]